jgi:citrate lyase subunit beta / citryl-CoA lyase
MPTYARPLRSMLFVPGNRAEWIGKAAASGADAIIIDLSDAVPQSDIDLARRNVTDFLAARSPLTRDVAILVRTNEVRSPLFEGDLSAAIRPKLYGIMLPLVDSPDDVATAVGYIDKFEQAAGVAVGKTVVVPSLETAASLRLAYQIAIASDRVEHVGAGSSDQGDIARSIGYRWSEEGMESLAFRSMALLEARAAGIAYPVSGMWTTVEDLIGLRRYAEQTRNLGYAGMMAIHPSHISTINEVFSPTAADIAHWQLVLTAMRSAQSAGVGATRLNGRLIDEAHARTALQGLEYAHRLGLTDWQPTGPTVDQNR